MKTIIVATDFSTISDNATDYALRAAQVVQARVILFHLHFVSVHVSNARLSPAALQQSMDQNKEVLEKKAQALAAQFQVDVTAAWRTGDFYAELAQLIDEVDADLVVMGMAKKSVEQDLLGNTTTAAINKLKFPILAVPEEARFEGITKVLYACDIVKGVHARVLNQVRKLALSFGAEVEIFHVSDKIKGLSEHELPPHLVNAFGDGLDGINYSYRNVASNAVLNAIEQEVNEMNADVVIMVPYKYGFWGSLVHKSKTRALASGIQKPLLSIPIG